MNTKIHQQLERAKKVSSAFGLLPHVKRIAILKNLTAGLKKHKKAILAANERDQKRFTGEETMRDRLTLNDARINGMIAEITNVIQMPDPLGETFDYRERLGLTLSRIRVPIGLLGIIYESRPNVTTDAAAIAIKSGNAVALKGGRDARETYIVLHQILKEALRKAGTSPEVVQFIDPNTTDGALSMLEAKGLIDVIIPRGSSRLINFVRDNSKVPVIETGAGVCHTFVDASAKLIASAKIIFNAKTQRPSVCNALDTALIHKKIAQKFLPLMAKLLLEKQVEIFADADSFKILATCYPKTLLKKATVADFGREFLSQKMSVKVVSGIDEALTHIAMYSSKHSEAILSENKKNCMRFSNAVDAAVVYTNASTRFSDGAVFGVGSEIGISTDKIHARGPMGPREMTTYKWIVSGKYATRQ